MRPITILAIFALLSSTPAQKQASTLFALARRAPLVLRVQVEKSEHVAKRLRLQFKLIEALRGSPRNALLLEEALARHCGASCAGLEVGQALLFFGEEIAGKLHSRGAARGLVHETQARLAAVRALLAAKDDRQRLSLALSWLEDSDARIADDAALALPLLQGLEDLDTKDKLTLQTALTKTSPARPSRLYGLLLATTRAAPDFAIDRSLKLWFDHSKQGWHGLAQAVLLQEVARSKLVTQLSKAKLDVVQRARTAELFYGDNTARRDASTTQFLRRLAHDDSPSVRREALATLLEAGSKPAELGPAIDRRSLTEARALLRERQSTRPRFRAIRPRNAGKNGRQRRK